MARRTRLTRAQAALLLGVEENASVDDIQRAWRVWVRLAHPDAGGDRDHFEELMRARRCLLALQEERPDCQDAQANVPPRKTLRSVVIRPTAKVAAVLVGLVLAALALAIVTVDLPAWLSAVSMGLSATAFALVAKHAVLRRRGDVGHQITFLVATWSPLALAQVAVSVAVGSTVITALPVLALPFVVAVALVNPGAGLWRPSRFPAP